MIDLGGGEAVAFKVESHNHPSAVEPFQGAATGVGGILRDIVAMGARPVALLDGLRFGAPDWHFDRAVAGRRPLRQLHRRPERRRRGRLRPRVRGQLPRQRDVRRPAADRARAPGEGDRRPATRSSSSARRPAATGSAARRVLASQELGEGADDKRPSVQVGDPFTGKKLIEVSQELVERGLVVALQDCGAAGLASSLSEMAGRRRRRRRPPRPRAAARGRHGAVGGDDLREPGADGRGRPARTRRPQVVEVCERWELHVATIGEVTDTGRLRAFWDGEVVGDVEARFLTDECPRYRVESRPRPQHAPPQRPSRARRPEPAQPRLGLPAVRPARRLAHRAPARPRRGGDPPAAVAARTRRLARRAARRRARPVPGGRARRPRRGAQRRLRRAASRSR